MILALLLAAAMAAPPEDKPQSPQERMDALQQVYDQSCGGRGYGQYDDVCNAIRDQIRLADKELAREARHPHKLAEKPAPTLPPTPGPAAAATDMAPSSSPPGGYSATTSPPKR